jgi:hypothetical protein
MTRVPRHAAGLIIVLVLALSSLGCGARQDRVQPPEATIPPCPSFGLFSEDSLIVVPPGGERFVLGPGTELEFAAGAVGASASYHVRAMATSGGQRAAGVEITPVGAAPRAFHEPVRLRLSYAACPWENAGHRLFIVRRQPGQPAQPMGGGQSNSMKFVETYLGHFTGFAIAF